MNKVLLISLAFLIVASLNAYTVKAASYDEVPLGTATTSTPFILSDMLNRTVVIVGTAASKPNVAVNGSFVYYVVTNSTQTSIYKSSDGISFNYVGNIPEGKQPLLFETDSRGDIFAGLENYPGSAGAPLYKSSDGGQTFNVVANSSGNDWWGFDEYVAGGILYAAEYSTNYLYNGSQLWRSADYGNTWSVALNLTNDTGIRHLHKVMVNQNNGDVYVTAGDANRYTNISYNNGSTFTDYFIITNPIISNDGYTAMFDSGDYLWFGTDKTGYNTIYRLKSNKVLDAVFDPPRGQYDDAIFSIENNSKGVLFATIFQQLAGTQNSLWASPDSDGLNWVMLYNYSNQTSPLRKVTKDIAGYQYMYSNWELSRFNSLDKDELRHLIFAPVDRKNNIIQYIVTFNGTFYNGTDTYFSLYQDPIENASITLTGINTTNLLTNPSFESGTTGWTSVSSTITATSVYGVTAANITSGNGYQDVNVSNDTYYTITGYVKGTNLSDKTNALYVDEYNATGGYIGADTFAYYSGTFGWRRLVGNWKTSINTTKVRIRLNVGSAGYAYYDGLQLQRGNLSTQFLDNNNTQQASNISIFINGEYVNATKLNDGESITVTLTKPLIGLIKITPVINGSGVVNYSISGTRMISAESLLISNSSGSMNISKIY